jgi:Tfp pilus assembly protein PilF
MARNQTEMQRASDALAQGRAAEAERLLSKVLKKQPRNADAHNLRALAFMQRQNTGPALEHARKAVDLNPDNHRFRGNLGSALMVQGRSEAALAELTRAIEISPDYVHARRNRGILNLAMRRFGDAVEDMRVVVRHAPDRADARLALADALIESGRFDDAIEHMKAAETLDGTQSATWKYMWGRLMFRSGRYKEAHQAFSAALLADPEKMEHYAALGAAAYHCGELREAERITTACFRKFPAKERGPKTPEARILVLEPRQEGFFSTLPRGPYPYDTTNFISFMPCERLSYTYAIFQNAESLAAALDLDRFDLVYNNCVVPETFELNGRTAHQSEIATAFSVDVVNPPQAVAISL